MHETNERVKHLLKKQINEVVDRGDISPNEIDCIKDAYEVLQAISTIEAMDEYADDYGSYRGGRSMRRGRGSYGRDGSYGYEWDDERSMRRGRGADGRYVSMEGSYANNGGGGRSGHSVKDRMIASLEKEMDYAESEYERQQIMEEIRRLRESKD